MIPKFLSNFFSSKPVQAIEHDAEVAAEKVKEFAIEAADFLIKKHGAQAALVGLQAAKTGAAALINSDLTGDAKKQVVSNAIVNAAKTVAASFDQSDLNSMVEIALKVVQGNQ